MNSAECSPSVPNANEIDQQQLVKHLKYFLWKAVHEKKKEKKTNIVNIKWLSNSSRSTTAEQWGYFKHLPITKPTVTSSGKRILSQIPMSFPFPATGNIRSDNARLMQKPAPPVANQNLAVEPLASGFRFCEKQTWKRKKFNKKKNDEERIRIREKNREKHLFFQEENHVETIVLKTLHFCISYTLKEAFGCQSADGGAEWLV